jgi:putative restriction endonuclease
VAKAIFTTKISPTYDDIPEVRYHFPRTYLRQAEEAVGDWIIYYEPRRPSGDLMKSGGRQAYFATARVDRVVPDPNRPDHFYAEVSSFLQFTRAVPFKVDYFYYESALRKSDGSTNKGAFGRAIRLVPDEEYELIWRTAFGPVVGVDQAARNPEPESSEQLPLVAEEQTAYLATEPLIEDRKIIEQLVSRPFRDRAFALAVKAAYDDTCAVTGLKIINGGGRSEAQAAHIRPVADNGPDSVRNGIALSGTIHWMFDRGLLSIDDSYRLLVAESKMPAGISRLLPNDGRLRLPPDQDAWPHPTFLAYHRATYFKG